MNFSNSIVGGLGIGRYDEAFFLVVNLNNPSLAIDVMARRCAHEVY